MAVNCDQLRKEDILHMLEKVLYEFPLQQMEFYIPKWVELLADDHPLKAELLQKIREMCREKTRLKDAVGGKQRLPVSMSARHCCSRWILRAVR